MIRVPNNANFLLLPARGGKWLERSGSRWGELSAWYRSFVFDESPPHPLRWRYGTSPRVRGEEIPSVFAAISASKNTQKKANGINTKTSAPLLPACGGKWPQRSEGRWGETIVTIRNMAFQHSLPPIPASRDFPPLAFLQNAGVGRRGFLHV